MKPDSATSKSDSFRTIFRTVTSSFGRIEASAPGARSRRIFHGETMTRQMMITILILPLLLLLTTGIRAQAPPTRTVEIYGQKIRYVEAGAGPHVILLHGLADDYTVWEQTIPALSGKYHVWAPDQLGFGQSDKPLINYRVSVLVEFLQAFCRKLGIEKATLVGNSLGGWVGTAFALACPDKVEKLVLVGSAGYWPKAAGAQGLTREQLTRLSVSTVAAYRETLKWMLHDETMLTDSFTEAAWTSQLRRNDGYTINSFIESILRREDWLDEKIRRIKAPTLIIWGRQDEVTPLLIGEAFAREIPKAQTAFIDRCGHLPQFECPAPFNAALLRFLNE
jgi:pimeloyl-ACP methyl ester carboxylesterase